MGPGQVEVPESVVLLRGEMVYGCPPHSLPGEQVKFMVPELVSEVVYDLDILAGREDFHPRTSIRRDPVAFELIGQGGERDRSGLHRGAYLIERLLQSWNQCFACTLALLLTRCCKRAQ